MANHCRIFTPLEYVSELLDQMNYSHDLYGKQVLENSCGTGNILCVIVERYIASCLESKIPESEIKRGLEKDIISVEIKEDIAEECRRRLDELSKKYGITNVRWNLIVDNYLSHDFKEKFDFIVSNPPYITFRDIPKHEREMLRKSFSACQSGRFDYYYAFIEKSICKELKPSGKAAFIVPAGLYRNVFAKKLRELIIRNVSCIYDYSSINKFPGTTTSSTVIHFNGKGRDSLQYYDVKNSQSIMIYKKELGEKWVFEKGEHNELSNRFGDYYCVHNTIATLYNKAFILDGYINAGDYYISTDNNDKVEASLVRPAFSPKNERKKRKNEIHIIFPYYFDKSVSRIDEESFTKEYPFASAHLDSFREQLDARAKDKKSKWYEYGRSQALTHVCEEKLVLPVVFSNSLSVYHVNAETVPVAGMFITKKKESERSLEEARRLLLGDGFKRYLTSIGITTIGKSKRLTAKDIEDYCFVSWE